MSERFEKFTSTNLYVTYGHILDVNTDLTTEDDFINYEDQLQTLRLMFMCYSKPTYKQIVNYISSFENTLPKNDIIEFSILVEVIFTKFMYFPTLLHQRQVQTKKKLRKDKINLEKEQQKKINNEVITCTCGVQHIRKATSNHLASVEHKIRIEAINWYKLNQEKDS